MRRAVALGVVTLLACSTASTEDAQRVDHVASAIINGTVDTVHPAVVYLVMSTPEGGAACTGTLVKVDAAAHVGWVATAAHCVRDSTPYAAFIGTDAADAKAIELPALDWDFDPRFEPNAPNHGYDFGMIRVAGVDATTPVLPLASAPDGLVVGTSIDSVGYGRTTVANQPDDNNTVRHHVTKSLSGVSDLILDYDEPTSGGCFGDSGGPMLLGSVATKDLRIVGIHSYTIGDCDVAFSGARVTSGLSFYDAQLTKALPSKTCETCKAFARAPGGTCAPRWADCKADADCKDFYDCFTAIEDEGLCAQYYPRGERGFLQATECACTKACTDACKADAYCSSIPKCGVVAPQKTCNSCLEGSCCAEAQACADDALCASCWRDGTAASCGKSQTLAALRTCSALSCAEACAPPPPPDAGAPPHDAGTPDAAAPDAEAPATELPDASPSPPSPSPPPSADAGTTAPPPANGEDDGCNAAPRTPDPERAVSFVLFGLFLLVRLRPYRSARR